jgi:hypothetical protein
MTGHQRLAYRYTLSSAGGVDIHKLTAAIGLDSSPLLIPIFASKLRSSARFEVLNLSSKYL